MDSLPRFLWELSIYTPDVPSSVSFHLQYPETLLKPSETEPDRRHEAHQLPSRSCYPPTPSSLLCAFSYSESRRWHGRRPPDQYTWYAKQSERLSWHSLCAAAAQGPSFRSTHEPEEMDETAHDQDVQAIMLAAVQL